MFEKVKHTKIITGFNNYTVSDTGIVKNKKTGRVLRQYNKKGYMYVFLYSNGIRKCKAVHRLVAEHFIKNNGLPQVNHKDENPQNNCVNNLEWCTAKYNCNYGSHNEKIRKSMLINNPLKGRHHSNKTKEKMRLAKIGKPSKRKRVVTIDGVSYESVTEAMSILGLSTRALYRKLGE